jgi:hypothetical protein
MTYERRPVEPRRLIFANLVNRLMIEVPTPSYARSLSAVAHRKLWLAREGDIVLTPRPIDRHFREYACELLGVDEARITMLSPDAGDTELLADAVQRSPIVEEVADAASSGRELEMLPFTIDEATLRLARGWQMPVVGYDPLPSPEVSELVSVLNTKSGFRELVAGLGIPTLPGIACEGRAALESAISEIVADHGGAIVKCDRSSNGYGHLIVRPGSDVAGGVQQHFADTQQPMEFTVEALANFVSVPSVEMIVSEDGVELLYVCDQRCPNASFSGMETPPRDLSREHAETLLHAGRTFGEYLHTHGIRSVFDIDAGITADGEMYVTETNLRRTGGTYIDTLVRRLVCDPYDGRCAWLADSRPAGSLRDFTAGARRLEAAGLAFEGESGVALTADTLDVDAKWRYLIVAPTLSDADVIEREAWGALGLGA